MRALRGFSHVQIYVWSTFPPSAFYITLCISPSRECGSGWNCKCASVLRDRDRKRKRDRTFWHFNTLTRQDVLFVAAPAAPGKNRGLDAGRWQVGRQFGRFIVELTESVLSHTLITSSCNLDWCYFPGLMQPVSGYSDLQTAVNARGVMGKKRELTSGSVW